MSSNTQDSGNQDPKNLSAAEGENEELESEEDQVLTLNAEKGAAAEDEFAETEEAPETEQHDRSLRRPTNAREVLTQFIPNRSERADEKLRSHLVGKIGILVDGPNEHYLFEWLSGRASVKEEKGSNVDCSINLSEQNLMRVVAGELNPQLAMLSGKIQVQGNAEAAIYFFNLIAPRNHH